jgi:hypothetical protein
MLGQSDEDKEQQFRAFETSKISMKVANALAKHASDKNCNHTIADILAMVLVEKVEGYMIGEDLVDAQDREFGVFIRSKSGPKKADIQIEGGHTEDEIKRGLSEMFRSHQNFWRIIREHLEEGDNEGNGLRCTHRPSEILKQIAGYVS